MSGVLEITVMMEVVQWGKDEKIAFPEEYSLKIERENVEGTGVN